MRSVSSKSVFYFGKVLMLAFFSFTCSYVFFVWSDRGVAISLACDCNLSVLIIWTNSGIQPYRIIISARGISILIFFSMIRLLQCSAWVFCLGVSSLQPGSVPILTYPQVIMYAVHSSHSALSQLMSHFGRASARSSW